MAHKAPGKAHRNGISLVELFRIFPDDDSAQAWLEEQRWGGEPWCPHCGSFHVKHNPNNRSLPWRCAERECRKKFSVRFRHSDAGVSPRVSDLGGRHLPPHHVPEGPEQYEAAPRPQHHPEVGLVPRPPHPQDIRRACW